MVLTTIIPASSSILRSLKRGLLSSWEWKNKVNQNIINIAYTPGNDICCRQNEYSRQKSVTATAGMTEIKPTSISFVFWNIHGGNDFLVDNRDSLVYQLPKSEDVVYLEIDDSRITGDNKVWMSYKPISWPHLWSFIEAHKHEWEWCIS